MLKPSTEFAPGFEMVLVNVIRERLDAWRMDGYRGITRTTRELLQWWRREGRNAIEIIMAIYQSARSGELVKLPLKD